MFMPLRHGRPPLMAHVPSTHRPLGAQLSPFRYSQTVGRVVPEFGRIVAGNPQGDVDVTSIETGPSVGPSG